MVRPLDNQAIRSFIAVELPDEVTSGLRELQAGLKLPGHTFVKWVTPEGIHLTLKFLGNISPHRVAEMTRVMEEASQGVSCFRLTVGGLGAFPNLRRPRVLWIGVGGEVEKLVALQQDIDHGLKPLGFVPEARPFTPHLTLARLREGASPEKLREFGDLVAKKPVEDGWEIVVSSLSLMRSQLFPSGAAYSCLTKVELKG